MNERMNELIFDPPPSSTLHPLPPPDAPIRILLFSFPAFLCVCVQRSGVLTGLDLCEGKDRVCCIPCCLYPRFRHSVQPVGDPLNVLFRLKGNTFSGCDSREANTSFTSRWNLEPLPAGALRINPSRRKRSWLCGLSLNQVPAPRKARWKWATFPSPPTPRAPKEADSSC